jgi:hypothetical protein
MHDPITNMFYCQITTDFSNIVHNMIDCFDKNGNLVFSITNDVKNQAARFGYFFNNHIHDQTVVVRPTGDNTRTLKSAISVSTLEGEHIRSIDIGYYLMGTLQFISTNIAEKQWLVYVSISRPDASLLIDYSTGEILIVFNHDEHDFHEERTLIFADLSRINDGKLDIICLTRRQGLIKIDKKGAILQKRPEHVNLGQDSSVCLNLTGSKETILLFDKDKHCLFCYNVVLDLLWQLDVSTISISKLISYQTDEKGIREFFAINNERSDVIKYKVLDSLFFRESCDVDKKIRI